MGNSYALQNKKVLITGALGQIGQVLVETFLKNGAFVYALDLQSNVDEIFKEKVSKYSDNYVYLSGDIRTQEFAQAVLDSIEGTIDVLVNCAGIGVYTPLESRTEEELDDVIATNLKGTIWMSKIVAERMKKQNCGTIINFGSIYGITTPDFRIYGDSGRNSSEIYGATKAGIIHFTKYLAAYLAPYGITANAISPGGVFRAQSDDFVKNYEYKTPLARMATPDDLVGTILFLASDDARYITGQNIAVDGGFTVW
jgi:NAD(P)-dependent dehydrogenase (short-subunit alcohol dehydrogenase family)